MLIGMLSTGELHRIALEVLAERMGLDKTTHPYEVVRAVERMANDNLGLRQALAEAREALRNREAEADEWRVRALAAE